MNSKHLYELEELGFGSDIDAFESYIGELQDAAADGEPIVQDPVYDSYVRFLKDIKPDSKLLTRNWEKESEVELTDYDELLKQYGMRSIRTCTNREDIEKYLDIVLDNRSEIEVCASFKLNGHACRVVYQDGYLVNATTRGRYKKGRDITRHLKHILGEYNEYLSDYKLVEIRGELIVSYSDFNNTLKYTCRTPLSAVTSLVKDKATDAELDMLHFLAYKIIIKDEDILNTLADEMEYLGDIGFEVPNYSTFKVSRYADIEYILTTFEAKKKSGITKYDTDGIVIGVNDNSEFYALGLDGNAFKANIAVKMGIWECNMYSGIIEEIIWEHGKKWFTPKARITPVLTVTGARVGVVPLYNVGVMNKLGLVPGSTVHFRFGGETGVQLLTAEGLSVTSL